MRIVEMALQDVKLSKLLTKEAFENAIRVNAAIGGSTNAAIHLKAFLRLGHRCNRPISDDQELHNGHAVGACDPFGGSVLTRLNRFLVHVPVPGRESL